MDATSSERLQLSILVATHVWGDPVFAQAAAAAHAAAEQAKEAKRGDAAEGGGRGDANGEVGDCSNGVGKRYFTDGCVYEGAWKDSKQHGGGVMRYANGDCYDGDWKEGKQCGIGVMRYARPHSNGKGKGKGRDNGKRRGAGDGAGAGAGADGGRNGGSGNVYTGEYKDGVPDGHGVFAWYKGHVYDGAWAGGKQHGAGTKRWPNGNIHNGNWESGKAEGYCVFTFGSNRRVWKGNFGNEMSEEEREEYRKVKSMAPAGSGADARQEVGD